MAINRLILGESFHGLLIKRTFLNEYLKSKGNVYSIVFSEKRTLSLLHIIKF